MSATLGSARLPAHSRPGRRQAPIRVVRARALLVALLVAPLIALASPPAAGAGDLVFSAAVDRSTVGLGEQFQLELTVQGENMSSVPTPTLPALPDFSVLGSTSSQSTSISIVNGQMKRQASISFIYGLAGKRLGKLSIPPCRLAYQGREYASQPVEITVVKGAQGQAAPAPQSSASPGGGEAPGEGNLALLAEPNRRTAYVGEPITLEISVATRLRITGGGWAEAPTFEGFWVEKILDADKFDFRRRTVGGRAYEVSLLKKVALFPMSPGDVTIKHMALNVAVLQPSRDFFGMFGSPQSVKVESRPITLHVLPLPDRGKPAEFSGGVGRFTMSASLDRATSSGSEPVSLTVRIAGSGNVRMIEKPVIAPVTGLRILAPEIRDDVHVNGDDVRGTKTLRYPIMAQADGKYVIAAIRMAYFDPQAKAYRTLEAGPFEFAASGTAPNAPVAEASGLKVLGTDINYIKSDATSLPVTPSAPPWWPNLLYVLSLATVAGAFGYREHSARLLSDRGYARKVRSSGLAKRRLRQAEGFLGKRDEKAFHSALATAVVGYIGDRFNIDTHAMTKDQLRDELERAQVRPETRATIMEVLEHCETARFAPAMLAGRDPRALFEKARTALGQV